VYVGVDERAGRRERVIGVERSQPGQ
jgi:hypothetical protein